MSAPISLVHIDVHLCIGIRLCQETPAKDIVDAGGRLHIDRNLTRVGRINRKGGACLVFSWIDGHVTAAHKVLDDNWLTVLGLFDIHSDISTDTAALIIATIDFLEIATGDGQMDITGDMGFVGTATYIFYL